MRAPTIGASSKQVNPGRAAPVTSGQPSHAQLQAAKVTAARGHVVGQPRIPAPDL